MKATTQLSYFLSGLAALLGLVAFALLILACSYFNLAEDIQNAANEERDLEASSSKLDKHKNEGAPRVFDEKYLVVLAGQVRPTFLATPISNGTTLFGQRELMEKSSKSNWEMVDEKMKHESNDDQRLNSLNLS
ncbi:protein GLUTAMINE DUMPER 3-like [Rutidosis leptorrhynchoides]|uniref:protein GLUTAMINE DUMPER 3-like n=1 Tax=Rutidosis leptorrhynchoides TaxID=125765 RepID=UPI003A98F6DD